MMLKSLFTTIVLFLAGLMPAGAHEVHHTISTGNAVIVQLKYADNTPFAFEAFEAIPEGADTPAQVGRTDAEGRAVFAPGAVKHWRFKAYGADGHGIGLNFDVPEMSAANTGKDRDEAPNRASLVLFGLSLLLGVFGLYQLWLRKTGS